MTKGNLITTKARKFFSNPRNEIGGISVYAIDCDVNEGNIDWINRDRIMRSQDLGFRFLTYKNNPIIVLNMDKDFFTGRWYGIAVEFNNAYTSFDDAPGFSFVFNRYALFKEAGAVPYYDTEEELLETRLRYGNLQLGANTFFIESIWGCKFRGEQDMSDPDAPEDTVLNQLRRQFPYYATL